MAHLKRSSNQFSNLADARFQCLLLDHGYFPSLSASLRHRMSPQFSETSSDYTSISSSIPLPSFKQLIANLFPESPSVSLELVAPPSTTGWQHAPYQDARNVQASHNPIPVENRSYPSPTSFQTQDPPHILQTIRTTAKLAAPSDCGRQKRSSRVSEPWMDNIVDLGPNDNGTVTSQCLYHDPVAGFCGYEAKRSTVVRHFTGTHLKLRPNVCGYPRKNGTGEICGRAFAQKSSMHIHIRTMHTGETPVKCPVPGCSKVFADPAMRNKHIETCHTEVQGQFVKPRKKQPYKNARQKPEVQKPYSRSGIR